MQADRERGHVQPRRLLLLAGESDEGVTKPKPPALHSGHGCRLCRSGPAPAASLKRVLMTLLLFISTGPAPCRAAPAISGHLGEVVGASGRIGSLLLRAGEGGLAAVPRGLAPGGLSPLGTPIIVVTPASALGTVLRSTPPERVCDLVLLCNGLVLERVKTILGAEPARHITAGCVFFGVLSPGAPARHGACAPPTTLAGAHAETVASLIRRMGPRCEVCTDLDSLQSVAQLKMVWSSALWLVCNARGCAVDEAHTAHSAELRALVDELLAECSADLAVGGGDAALAKLRAYSDSMPGVIPSAELARHELPERNGWFLRRAARLGRRQPTHESLLHKMGIDPAALRTGASGSRVASDSGRPLLWLHEASGLRFQLRGASAASERLSRSVVVVGAGIMGSALALELARCGLRVTVVDQRSSPPDAAPPTGHVMCADATSGSFCWLNANGKDSMSATYAGLSRVGMAMWRRAAPYCNLAVWSGSVVASASAVGEGAGGGYAVEEDIAAAGATTWEPLLAAAAGCAEGGVHFHAYPDEGFSDPRAAVAAVRVAAEEAGALFRWGTAVESVLVEDGRAAGVRIVDAGGSGCELRADVVALVAGTGLASASLGAVVPMRDSPGVLAHTADLPDGAVRMGPIFVDALSGVHCLQHPNGRCAIGGDLRGSPLGDGGEATPCTDVHTGDAGQGLQRRAANWLPHIGQLALSGTTHTQRVLPEDGFPAVGWSGTSLYVCAAHSGFTLAPVLSALAAAEIVEGVEVELLDEGWRPTRFCMQSPA